MTDATRLVERAQDACWTSLAIAVRSLAIRRRSESILVMGSPSGVEVTALAINVTIPETLRWTATRRGETFLLTALNVRLLRDGHLAARAYGRPIGGGRGTYVSFPVPDKPELTALICEAADLAGSRWATHRGTPAVRRPE